MKKNLIEWLSYMQTIHVSAIDMGLSRVLPVAEKLNLLTSAKNAYVFTVAGTNGKGSTTAVIAEICKQAGYKTGLYQSPHLIDFNERIRINGISANDEQLIKAFEKVEQARLECNLSLSFFEMTTLASFLIFAKENCDVWVLEVGLGGRLDVVNIIEPNMTVITNIGIDHIDWLGDDREKIGYEKAGILRKNIPLVFGDVDMPKSVQNRIDELAVTCYQKGKEFDYLQSEQNHWYYSTSAITLKLPTPNLSLFNTSNAITSILNSSLNINITDIETALQKVKLAGRFDYRQLVNRQWLFDVAHNEAGVQFFLQQLENQIDNFTNEKSNIYLVFSMLKDKEIAKVVQLLSDNPLLKSNLLKNKQTSWYIAPINDTYCPRVTKLEQLEGIVSNYVAQDTIFAFNDLAQATQSVIKTTTPDDLILVCGSFHTISECLMAIDLL